MVNRMRRASSRAWREKFIKKGALRDQDPNPEPSSANQNLSQLRFDWIRKYGEEHLSFELYGKAIHNEAMKAWMDSEE